MRTQNVTISKTISSINNLSISTRNHTKYLYLYDKYTFTLNLFADMKLYENVLLVSKVLFPIHSIILHGISRPIECIFLG